MENKMEKIVSLAKRRGFVFPNSEIYGGLASSYDYGPLGAELKNNIKKIWWKFFVQDREDMVGMDSNIISSPKVWEGSGHVDGFSDPLVECKECHKRFRADKLEEGANCPDCGKNNWSDPQDFNLLFETSIGPIKDKSSIAYLRGETAQNIFVNYKNVLNSTNKKIPFGIGQMGKAFRNEITTGQFIFRTLEFEQMEVEYFISPKEDWEKTFEEWLVQMNKFGEMIGLKKENVVNVEIPKEDLAHYSKRTVDIEYKYPFGQEELWGLAYRGDYDLGRHQEYSKEKLEYFDQETNERYLPHVVEPSLGVDRTLLAVLCEAYVEEEDRVVLKLPVSLAPYKIAVAPLLGNKPELKEKAREVMEMLKKKWHCIFDERGNIGKRYKSQDEIGTPYFVVIDFDSLEDGAVTVRDRDTMSQERIKISDLEEYFKEKIDK